MCKRLILGAALANERREIDDHVKPVIISSYPFDSLLIIFEAVSSFNALLTTPCGQSTSLRSFE